MTLQEQQCLTSAQELKFYGNRTRILVQLYKINHKKEAACEKKGICSLPR